MEEEEQAPISITAVETIEGWVGQLVVCDRIVWQSAASYRVSSTPERFKGLSRDQAVATAKHRLSECFKTLLAEPTPPD